MSDVSVRMKLEDGVSSKLQKISSEARKASSEMKNAGQAMDSAFKSNAPESFASQAGEAMESVSSGAESLGESISEAFSGLGGEFNEFQDSANNLGDAMDEIARSAGAYQDANGRWHDANGKFIKSTDEAAKAARGLGEAAEDAAEPAEGLGESVEGTGNSMGEAEGKANSFSGAIKGLIAAVAGAKVVGELKDFIGDSIDIGKDFTSMMSEVGAISGASGSQLAQLEQTARDYGATTVFSATEAAEALKYMSLAGWDANQSSAALGGVLNLAAASGMGLGQASDMVTDYLSAFGMQASESTYFADMLAYAQSNSNTTAEQLGEAYRNSAANMHAAGQDVETTTSLLEAMANQGYKGSEAGTALAATMRDITQKMDNGAIKIGDTSIAVQDAQGNFRDLTDILTDVEDATDGMGGAQKAAALGSTFTADSIKALNMVLAEGMDTVAGYEEELRSAAGTSEDMAATMNDNLTGDMANMSSAFEEMQLQAFEGMEEPLRGGAQYITNEVIPILTGWLPDAIGTAANGIGKLGNTVKPLFETVLKNPKAIAETFTAMGTGMLAFKAVNAAGGFMKDIEGVEGIGGALQKIAPAIFAHPWAAGAAAVTAALVGIGFAVKEYNDLKVEENLTSHFGSISLDTSQVEALAGEIVPVEITADLQLANVTFDEAEQLVTEAEDVLAQNDYINWKINTLRADVSEADYNSLLTNTETFVSNVEDALEKEEYAAELTVKALLGDVESQGIIAQMQTWFAEDSATVSSLGSAVTDLLQKSIDEGAYNLNTQTAITIMQSKMMDIVNGAKNAELEGKLDWLSLVSSGAALDSESWAEVVTQVGEYQKELTDASAESYQQLFGYLEQAAHNDPSREGEVGELKKIIGQAFHRLDESSMVQSFDWMHNTLSDAYGSELEKASVTMQESTAKYRDAWSGYFSDVDEHGLMNDPTGFFNALETQATSFSSGLEGTATQKALLDRYDTMFPTVEQMQGKIDDYIANFSETGEKVPQALMDAYNQAIEIGAAAGDTGAMWQYMANSLVESGEYDSFMQKVEETGATIPQEFQTALTRAAAETSPEDYSGAMDALIGSLAGGEVDWGEINSILEEYGFSIESALQEQGIDIEGEVPVNAEGVQPDISKLAKSLEGLEATGDTITLDGGELAVEYEVTDGQTMSEIAQNAGIALDELIAANPQIENPNIIQVGQKINIPASAVEVDASGVGEAAGEVHSEAQAVADSVTSEPVTSEQQVNTAYTAGETDASQVTSQTQGELDSEFEAPLSADGTADVTITKASDNIPEVYSQVGSELKSAFATTFQVETNASIHVNYSIANPTANISFSGGGTGSASVSASLHADGGRFAEPHLGIVAEAGYPEYIIPMDGSDNAESLWRSAGEEMGLMDKPISETPIFATAPERGGTKESVGNGRSRDINLNINGNGKMTIGSNMSKEDVLNILFDNVKDALLNIIEQEILEEGDGVYEY